MIVVDLIQGSEEWLKWRFTGIGTSEAPVVEGISPYKAPRQLYIEKRTKKAIEEPGKAFIFEQGHKVEKMIRAEAEKRLNCTFKPMCVQHDRYPHLLGSLDGLDARLGLLEAKNVDKEVIKAAEAGVIPDHHYSQMQHAFNVSGVDVGQWYGYNVALKKGVAVLVKSNVEYMKQLEEKEHRFWNDVKVGKIPALSAAEYFEPEDEALLMKLKDAMEFAENAEAAFKSLKELVINTYNHPKIAGAGLKMFKVERKGSLSLTNVPEIGEAVEKLRAKLEAKKGAEYFEKYRGKASESWTIKIDGGK